MEQRAVGQRDGQYSRELGQRGRLCPGQRHARGQPRCALWLRHVFADEGMAVQRCLHPDDKTAIKNLPLLSATAGNKFVLAGAQAKALGLLSSNNNAFDGYIGFGNGVNYDYDRSNGISPGAFDFVGLAEHEIDHVLGHFSGIGDGYATAFDLFRCANGASTFSNVAGSYFSIDGCKTNLATFNSTGSGDRDDWASSSTSTDIQGAFLFPGVQYSISSADITALDV